MTTLAGDGTAGLQDGQGREARFNGPLGIAVDASGRRVRRRHVQRSDPRRRAGRHRPNDRRRHPVRHAKRCGGRCGRLRVRRRHTQPDHSANRPHVDVGDALRIRRIGAADRRRDGARRRRLCLGRARDHLVDPPGRLVANRGRVGPRVSRWSGARSALQEAERGCGGRRGTFDRGRRGKRVGAAGRRAVAPRVPGASRAADPSAVRPRDVSGAAVGMADRADRGPARDRRHGWRSARRRRRAHAPRHRRACRTGHARARSSRRRCGQPDVARGVRHAQRDDHAWSRHLHSRARRARAEQCGLRSDRGSSRHTTTGS